MNDNKNKYEVTKFENGISAHSGKMIKISNQIKNKK